MGERQPGFARFVTAFEWTRRHFGTLAFAGFVVAIIGLVMDVGKDVREKRAMESENVAQATAIAIDHSQLQVQEMQLQVQRTMAALVAESRGGPTATAIAQQASHSMAQLVSTLEALEGERHKIEPTLTAAALRVAALKMPSVSPSSSLAARLSLMREESQIPGLSAELTEFSKFENMVTIKLRFINSTDAAIRFWVTGNSYLLDEAAHKRYGVTEQSNAGPEEVPAGGTLEVWAKYALSEGENSQYLTVVVDKGLLFEHLEVP
ncbi:MAG: hypothetical protein A2Y73_03225 [Chloroflexi bacterium RBG_13_56_8]|nr:MAG: hypothetical protein A2Y73_03225 [Chloroflexi bacterium RBG_13_56_8]